MLTIGSQKWQSRHRSGRSRQYGGSSPLCDPFAFSHKDDNNIDQAALDNNPDVKGTFKTNGQYQIIIGPGDVNFVYDELIKETGLKEASTEDLKKIAEQGKKFNPIMAFIKLLSDIFVPIIPALVAGGLLMALNNFLTSKGLFGPQRSWK